MTCRNVIGSFIAAIILVMAYGCATTGCLENQNAIPLADFYSSQTQSAISLSDISIVGVGAPGDSAILETPPNASQVYLPMRSARQTTSWAIFYNQEGLEGVSDTIHLSYTSEPYFASSECGAMYIYHLTSVSCTTNVLDSVGVLDSLITNVDKTYLRFYFRTE